MSPAVLAEIIDLVIRNARAHGADAIRVTVRDTADAFAVEGHDQGLGSGPNADKAFRRAKGHGIGLALARSLVHSQGARLIGKPVPGRPYRCSLRRLRSDRGSRVLRLGRGLHRRYIWACESPGRLATTTKGT